MCRTDATKKGSSAPRGGPTVLIEIRAEQAKKAPEQVKITGRFDTRIPQTPQKTEPSKREFRTPLGNARLFSFARMIRLLHNVMDSSFGCFEQTHTH
jgi:hypothetical protein